MSLAALPLALALLNQADPPKMSPADLVSALESALSDAIAKAEPSVVAIVRFRSENDETTAIRGQNPAPVGEEMVFQGRFNIPTPPTDILALPGDFGSGVVVGPKGEILTVYHLVRGAKRIAVRAPGRQEFDAEILAADPRSDLAVIVPRESPRPPTLKPIAVADASKLRPGAFLLALGNPYNAAKDGRASASWGILSNTARRMERIGESREAQQMEVEHFRYRATLLQLDAKLNLGMSGGAVVNLKGELVGITTAAGSPSGFDAQAGYAIPMDALGRKAVETLKEGKEVEYAFLGINLSGVPNKVGGVRPGTPAAEGNLVQDDLIVEINGIPVVGEDGLALALSTAPVGKPISVKVLRENALVETVVVVSKYPITSMAGRPIATNRPAPWRGLRVDFTSVLSGGTFNTAILDLMAMGGVGIVEVDDGSPADLAGLKKGQVILSVDGTRVRTPAAFSEAVAKAKGPVKLETFRGMMSETVTVPEK